MSQQEEAPKGRVNKAKYCRDCPDSEIHGTGSTLWISCRFQSGWRDINAVCNLPEKETTP